MLYLGATTAWGAWLGRGQASGADYFLGSRSLPWGAVMLSVVATETSTLTFLSIPGVAYAGSLVFLQLTLGYLAGRTIVAFTLLPAYYRGELATAYELLDSRFGPAARRVASGVFMVTRLLADSVRLFATAIPLALVTDWPYPASIAAITLLTVIYTYLGGIRAVVWVDAVQMGLYLLGAGVALAWIHRGVPGGWGQIFADAAAQGKLDFLDLSLSLSAPYTLLAGVVGGAAFTMASHGTDQLIVQRLLTCRSRRDAQKALIGSGVAAMLQFLLFLLVGIGLWSFFGERAFERTDEIFATFIVEALPPGLTGLLIACVFAAAMSSLSSSINSLASATAYDFWAPMTGAARSSPSVLRAGKAFTLAWAALLGLAAVAFIPLSERTSAVEVALGIAAVVYGALLGAFALGAMVRGAGEAVAILSMAAGVASVIALHEAVAWLWYVPSGALVTLATGWVASGAAARLRRPE